MSWVAERWRWVLRVAAVPAFALAAERVLLCMSDRDRPGLLFAQGAAATPGLTALDLSS